VLVSLAESARARAKSDGKFERTTVVVAVGWPTT
jgi:hypothetical protein